MQSPFCGLAIENAIRYSNALLKFISPNDVGLTGGHQCGFYLPKSVYQMFTPHPPTKGENSKHQVRIQWQDEIITESVVTWYGKAKDEYRLTRFGRGFPFLVHDTVGDLLVLIPKTADEFLAYILDLEEDIEEIQAALGMEVTESWGIYQNGVPQYESEDECVDRHFRRFAELLRDFPRGEFFSEEARRALKECMRRFTSLPPDDVLMTSMDAEYQLFRLVERQVCQAEIVRVKKDVDDFLRTASSIMNRRKARAGRSLENHVEFLLKDAGISHKMRPTKIDGKPDIVIPSEEAYFDSTYPLEKLFVVGVKTTCKDRWRQVLNEGKRVPDKYILTIQQGISTNQLNEMHAANVTLIVPQRLHKDYPKKRDVTLLNLEQFITTVRAQMA
ncbi:MAG TPA: type II restriction endonuclease [Pyrinomonadaceae bacterium]|nr:type II restriction endonuclease [Pyrinomonadaceae bacterium]